MKFLGSHIYFLDDTGNRKVRKQSILPLIGLMGADYQFNNFFFFGISIGYGMNIQNYRISKEGSFAYSANMGVIIPRTNDRLLLIFS